MKNPLYKTTPAIWLTALLSLLFLTGAATLVDPTRPPEALVPVSKNIKTSGPLQVTAIFIYPDHRYAIIGGEVVAVGDKVSEYTIINIQSDTVELKGSQDNSITLSLLPTVKKARKS